MFKFRGFGESDRQHVSFKFCVYFLRGGRYGSTCFHNENGARIGKKFGETNSCTVISRRLEKKKQQPIIAK